MFLQQITNQITTKTIKTVHMTDTTYDLEKEALEIFSLEIITQTKETVEMSDPDAAYTMFEDMGMFEHSECVEFLYFNTLALE